MPELESLQRLIGGDPILATTLLAAAFLAVTALATGAARWDFAVLRHPAVVLEVAAAVALGFALALGNDALRSAVLTDPDATWWLDGLRRLPLYLIALAYGPSVGLVTALLFGAFEAGAAGRSVLADPRVAILALELVVIGWLAIYPSPRQSAWSGPLHALVGYALAWGTAGLALLRFESGAVSWGGLVAQHAGTIGGVALSALLLATVSPASYRALFPRSRIAPLGERAPARPTLVVRADPATAIDRLVEAGPATEPATEHTAIATAERVAELTADPTEDRPGDAGAEPASEPEGAAPIQRRDRRSPSTALTQFDLPALELRAVRDRSEERRRRLDPPPEPE